MFGPTTWRTYAELGELAHAFGAGLRHLGIEPQPADAVSADHKGALVYDETSGDHAPQQQQPSLRAPQSPQALPSPPRPLQPTCFPPRLRALPARPVHAPLPLPPSPPFGQPTGWSRRTDACRKTSSSPPPTPPSASTRSPRPSSRARSASSSATARRCRRCSRWHRQHAEPRGGGKGAVILVGCFSGGPDAQPQGDRLHRRPLHRQGVRVQGLRRQEAHPPLARRGHLHRQGAHAPSRRLVNGGEPPVTV